VRFARGIRRHARAHSNTWVVKRVLLSALVVGGLSCFTLASTFALLTAESTNTNGSVSSGTLYLGNLPSTSASTCFSYNGALPSTSPNVNAACDALAGSAVVYPGGAAATAKVAISNPGSVSGATLALYMPSCVAVNTSGAPSPGTGNPCTTGGLELTIAETDSSWNPTRCAYPQTSGSCTFIANTLNALATTKNSSTSMYSLSEGLAAGQTRYFLISMELPSSAANTLQGRAAQFNLTWNLSQ
jgi:hypothetical protein